MQAWRVHRHGEPGDVFQLDEIPEPTAAALEGLGMHMSGWVPVQPRIEPFGSLAPVSVGISTMFEVPDSMSDEDAAAFMIPAHTAWHAVHRRGNVQRGEIVV